MKKQFFALMMALMMAALSAVPAMADGMEMIIDAYGVYVGEVKDGEPHGMGVWTAADGRSYRGEFVDGCREGVGVYTWDGGSYTGEFDCDVYHGKGIVSYDDGTYFVGEFYDDKRHGEGTLYAADGSVIESGRYEHGVLADGTKATAAEPEYEDICTAAIVGEWVVYAVKVQGVTVLAAEAGIDASMTFNDDGSCTLRSGQDLSYVTWTIEEDSLYLADKWINWTGDELHWTKDGDTIIFVRAE